MSAPERLVITMTMMHDGQLDIKATGGLSPQIAIFGMEIWKQKAIQHLLERGSGGLDLSGLNFDQRLGRR